VQKSFVLEVSIPGLVPRELNPNKRAHWFVKSQAAKASRETARLCAISVVNAGRHATPVFKKATLSVVMVIPHTKYTKDQDNSVACLKAYIDGCVDAGVIPDDSGTHLQLSMPVVYMVDKLRDPEILFRFKGVACK